MTHKDIFCISYDYMNSKQYIFIDDVELAELLMRKLERGSVLFLTYLVH